jgi:hypothetical protein
LPIPFTNNDPSLFGSDSAFVIIMLTMQKELAAGYFNISLYKRATPLDDLPIHMPCFVKR